MYNKVIIMGRITKDLELKATPAGVNVCQFSVAVDRRFQKQGEEKKTDFFNVVAWRQQAEFVTKYFGKGRMILVEGEMQSRKYTDKNGVERGIWELIADRVSFTGEKKEGGNSGTPSGTPPVPSVPSAPMETAASDDDYPF